MTTETTPHRLLLVDGHSLAYRAFYALPVENFTTETGQPTNAVYGFTSMLINAMRDERPTHMAVAFDAGRHTFRNDRYPEYKANRAASPEAFSGQVPLIRQVLDAMGVVSLEKPGFEADDLIATLDALTEEQNQDSRVLILTGDRDALQLVDERTTVLYPKRGVSDIERLGPAQVEAKYGVAPGVYADYAALRGDPSDNLPKIPGVGEKTAAKWIKGYGSLEGLLQHADEVPGRVGEALRAHVDQVRTNRELTELVRDVPVDLDLSGLRLEPMDPERIHEVFDALQLVDERTTVLYPKRGVSDIERLGPAEVEGKYGVAPGVYADYAALRGDPSDNLPKIPGVGEKTAAKWIK
ncbi:MAG: 5'-3' exonuclease H3TH domain-containing protein, partial [Candidatus Nanopelagicales bacterium]|nr:5'-3' exonuclease H3TH domain-containing protein [Candidatus Nanopelagicales bacterium]